MTIEKMKFVEQKNKVQNIVEKIALLNDTLNSSNKNEISKINEEILFLKKKLKNERQLLRKL